MKITITFDLDSEESTADPDDESGLTEAAFLSVTLALSNIGADDIQIEAQS